MSRQPAFAVAAGTVAVFCLTTNGPQQSTTQLRHRTTSHGPLAVALPPVQLYSQILMPCYARAVTQQLSRAAIVHTAAAGWRNFIRQRGKHVRSEAAVNYAYLQITGLRAHLNISVLVLIANGRFVLVEEFSFPGCPVSCAVVHQSHPNSVGMQRNGVV